MNDDDNTVEIGGQVMTQAQYDAARFPLLDERDRLRAALDVDDLDQFIREQGPEFAALVKISTVEAERDRLRAVVDATLVWLHDMTEVARDQGDHTVADVTARQYRTIVAQLDVSPTMGETES